MELDGELLEGLEIDLPKICTLLRLQIKNLKLTYWQLLFSHFDEITNRLTKANREALQTVLLKHTHVDFTEQNISAIVLWIAKNANSHIDSQLTTIFERMVTRANIVTYKSNQRVFGKDESDNYGWRFRQEYYEGNVTKIKLDYRIVIENQGGIKVGYADYRAADGLTESSTVFLQDLATVAHNLGFTQPSTPFDFGEWKSGKNALFTALWNGKRELFMEVKAFKNGNIHIRFSKAFAMALNVEYGRLKGWLLSAEDAAEELQEPSASEFFKLNHHLNLAHIPLLPSS